MDDSASAPSHGAPIDPSALEQLLRQSLLGPSAWFDLVSDAVIVTGADWTIQAWNGAAERIYGWPRSTALGQSFQTVLQVQRYENGLTEDDVCAALLRDGEWRGVVVQRARDGRELVIESGLRAIRAENGTIAATIGINRDVTARMAAETDKQRLEQQLSLLLHYLPVGIRILDEQHALSYTNPALVRLLAFSENELRAGAHRSRTFLHLDGSVIPLSESVSARAVAEQGPVQQEVGMVLEDGRTRWLDIHAVPLNVPGWGVATVVNDITARVEAEQALRASEERWRAIVDNSAEGVLLIDRDGRYSYVSSTVTTMLGYTEAEFRGLSYADLTHPDDLGAIEAMRARVLATPGAREQLIVRVRHRDGTWRWIERRIVNALDTPAVRSIIVSFHDVTERVAAEQALRASETRYRALAEHFPNGAVLLFDRELRYTLADGQGMAAAGLDKTAFPGATLWEMLPPEVARQMEPLYRAALAGRTEVADVPVGGTVYRTYVLPIRNAAGAVEGGMVMTQDIGAQVRAEGALRGANARLQVLADASRVFAAVGSDERAVLEAMARTMAEHMQAGTSLRMLSDDGEWLNVEMVFDSDPAIQALLQANASAVRIRRTSSHPSAQVIRSRQSVLQPAVDWEAFRQTFLPAGQATLASVQVHSMVIVPLRSEEAVIGTVTFWRHDPTLPAFTPEDVRLAEDLADRAGLALRTAGLIVSLRSEVDARVRAEAALTAEHARVIQLKDEFLAAVSHELRTPLVAVLGQAELLLYGVYGEQPPAQAQALRTIERNGRQLLALINDILDYTKFEAGGVKLDCQLVEAAGLCQYCMQAVMPTALAKQIVLSSKLDPAVPTLWADERRLRQILNNLLSNAVKFTPAGGSITLSTHGDAAQQRVTFAVEDTGIGIAERDFGRLFQPFGQLDSRLSRSYDGTGLGLALVRQLAEAHGGSVAMESVLGRGSRFSVTLPWQTVAQGLPAAARPDLVVSLPRARHGSPLILIAEDTAATEDMLQAALLAAGYRVAVARNAHATLEVVRRQRPVLVLLDIQLAGRPGLELLEQLRAEGAVEPLRVIALTTMVMPGDRERSLAAGAHAYVPRPVPLAQLLMAIAEQLADPETEAR